MSQLAKSASAPLLGLLLLAAIGCNQPAALAPEEVKAYQAMFILADEPDGVQTVADVRSALLGEEEAGHDDHDHDGDGHPDHEAADHDQDGDDHEGHDHDAHAGEDHDHDGDGHQDHDAHDHDSHDGHVHAHATEPQEVAMVGHIGGLANPWAGTQLEYPFAKTQAVFFLADPQAVVKNEESGHSHAPGEECAFCAAHAADQAHMLAVVQFVDEKGDVLPMDARLLFDVKEQDTVVVRGKAQVTKGGILYVVADGLYVRR